MLRIIFTLSFIFSIASSSIGQKNIIKGAPLALFSGILSGCYERSLGGRHALEVGGRINFLRLVSPNIGIGSSGYGALMGYKFYLSNNEVLNGYYFSSRIAYDNHSIPFLIFFSDSPDLSLVNINFNVGRQFVWNTYDTSSGFTLDVRLGVSYFTNTSQNIENFVSDGLVLPVLGFYIGHAFD